MARISTYQQDTNITTGDKLLGTDSGGGTKNFVISNLTSFLSESNTSGTSSSFTFRYKQSNRGQGDMNFVFSSGSTFANVTAIKVSKYNHNSQNVINKALELLNGKKVIIYDINNRNNYGVFDAANITVDSNDSNFYDLSLTKTKSNGSISDTTIYGIDLFAGSDVNFVHHQNSANTTWTINHNLGKFPSVSIKFSSSDEVYSNVGAFAGVIYTNENSLTINLAAAESGYAYLN
jgi:hypothetical protein